MKLKFVKLQLHYFKNFFLTFPVCIAILFAHACDNAGESCNQILKEINQCISSRTPEEYEGECIYILSESFLGDFTCEGAKEEESYSKFCNEQNTSDNKQLANCLKICQQFNPLSGGADEYLQMTSEVAECIGLQGWLKSARWTPQWIAMKSEQKRKARLRIESSPPFPVAFELKVPENDVEKISLSPGILVFTPQNHFAEVEIEGLAETFTHLTAVYDKNPSQVIEAKLPVLISDTGYQCSGQAGGTISAGEKFEVSDSARTGLTGSFIEFPPDESLETMDVTIGCSDDITIGDYTPIGPAVKFSPDYIRFGREVKFGIPINPALIQQEAKRSQIQIFYTSPWLPPRKIMIANRRIEIKPDGTGILSFLSPRLGTYQAAIDPLAGTREFKRKFTFRAIVGVSMGASGAAQIGLRHHELFDFVAPLGGPANWTYMLEYIHKYHLGGFCSSQSEGADIGQHCPVPPPSNIWEFTQEFEHWFYPDGWEGQGGTFHRSDYCEIFRDIVRAFGNPGLYNKNSTYLPPGVTEQWFKKSPEEKCAGQEGQVRLTEFYDRRYNPDGIYPVITFCDGAEGLDSDGNKDIGLWDPEGEQFYPLDITLAVDVNDNGKRDAGEPVISQPHEYYEDVGTDGIPDELEDGYDPVTNPDPAGDDYDYQFNPLGTEGNHIYDEGEPYLDYGLDGVEGTPQQDEGGYDYGEGNGKFDYNPNILNFWQHDAIHLINNLSNEELRRIDIMADAGIRDLFNFAPGINEIAGALFGRGENVNLWRNFASLYGSDDEQHYDSTYVDYDEIGKNFVILYGNPDATEEQLIRGDGGHVGTPSQILNRLMTATMAMSARWPGGDRKNALQDISEKSLMTIEFPSNGRTSQVSIFLPPGYWDEENFDVYYPVIYFLHGYGQQPMDLILSAIIFGNNMISELIPEEERMQKVIMVFPDGRCRFEQDSPEWQRECLKGSFYTDSSYSLDTVRGPMMESILLDLISYIDANYRTKLSEEYIVKY